MAMDGACEACDESQSWLKGQVRCLAYNEEAMRDVVGEVLPSLQQMCGLSIVRISQALPACSMLVSRDWHGTCCTAPLLSDLVRNHMPGTRVCFAVYPKFPRHLGSHAKPY